MTTLTNLLDFDPAQLVAYCAELGEKPFRAKQLQRWIHQFGASNFDDMTDLAKSLREKLKTRAEVRSPGIISDNTSTDGTRKWLVDVGNGNAVETVFAKLAQRQLKRGVFPSVVALQETIHRFVAAHNREPQPFVWKADPKALIAAAKRGYQALDSIH